MQERHEVVLVPKARLKQHVKLEVDVGIPDNAVLISVSAGKEVVRMNTPVEAHLDLILDESIDSLVFVPPCTVYVHGLPFAERN